MKTYIKPELEIVLLQNDIIATSDLGGGQSNASLGINVAETQGRNIWD